MKLKIFDTPTREQLFDDEDFWEVRMISCMPLAAVFTCLNVLVRLHLLV